MKTERCQPLVFCVITLAVVMMAQPLAAAPKNRPKRSTADTQAVIPEIPKSIFDPKGRNPFMLVERPIVDRTTLTAGALTEAQFKTLGESLAYKGSYLKGEQSWALINEQQFVLNKPTPLEVRGIRCMMVAVMIDETRVVLRLLDNTDRTIELLYRPR